MRACRSTMNIAHLLGFLKEKSLNKVNWMQRFSTFFKSVFLVIAISASSYSQDEKPTWFIGPYGAIMQSMHSTGFKDLPGYPSWCFSERSGIGIGYDIGMLLRFPINETMSFRLFGGINSPGATISSDEKIGNQFIRNPQFPFDTIDVTLGRQQN